jgi:hypothetical protein
VLFDPTSPAAAAAAIVGAWAERPRRSETGLVEAARWAPALMLAAYEELYAKLIAPTA